MLELLRIDPSLMQDGGDLLIKSMEAPYVNQLGERIRASLIRDGRIPEDQLTDPEREKIAKQIQDQQNQPPDPMDQLTQQALLAQIQKMQQDMQMDMRRFISDQAEKAAKTENMMADTLKKIADAIGADAIVTPAALQAFNNTARDLSVSTN
jgi:hypothetical protein